VFHQRVGNDPAAARLAVRQLVAMTQGIIRTSASGSGIARGSKADRFSVEDVAAMKVMSGCPTAG
jgi:hypothetical protein